MPNRTTDDTLAAAVDRGAAALLARLRADGVFAADGDRFAPANTAAAVVALCAAGGGDPGGVIAAGVRRLLATQRPDGGWAMDGVPSEPFSTLVVTAALRMAAPDEAGPAIAAGRELAGRLGGAAALPEPVMAGLVRQFDALAGFGDEAALPRLPLELLLLRGPARRLLSLRLPIFAALALGQEAQRRRGPLGRWLNGRARPAALAVVREAYEREGSTGGFSTDPWLTALICLGVGRSGRAPDIARAAADWLRAAARPDGGWDLMPLDITWSTFALSALLAAGAGAGRLEPVREMFRARQQDVPFTALACPAGHWGFSGDRSWPMALETAEVAALLRALPGGAEDRWARDGIGWLTSAQDRSGSWSLAVRDSKRGGFGPCPQMTAKAVGALLGAGVAVSDRRVARALEWLAGEQRADGSFEAMWYRGPVAGTAAVLEAYCLANRADHPVAAAAWRWLASAQHADGSWGAGDPTAPDAPPQGRTAPQRPGSGPPEPVAGTVEETAWALHALLVAGADPLGGAVVGAGRWLTERQRADGGWPGAPVNEYIRHCFRYTDDVIASGLAVRALARLRGTGARGGAA
ncbi:prenyltransferase/squalene oxidase repeat-containing protein [Streptomyces sp. SL13]|uniref:Prenyltransferase/squalene oxidase repeat-containing protein n=1 Tax=Streptantibioticus silvisoli TaxID=2705255 RepID=A0AA90H9C8_9ACTN|nr:prenyltransferase/squalene oxidase repeat-containing protein [Streptantibioticus silvisoli]MDI5971225.1 prenyltransferase/squalene oxidase repeat-containing protein [Streptantibioticus silvisoli]